MEFDGGADEAKFSSAASGGRVGFFRYTFALIVIPRVKGCWGRRGGQENFEFFMGFWSKIGRGPGLVAEFDDLTDLTEFDGGPAQN